MRIVVRQSGARSGAAAAELAVLLPFLAFLFTLVVDFCRAYQATIIVQNCADVAALNASGACDAPAYRPTANLLSDLGGIVEGLLGVSSGWGSTTDIDAEREQRGRAAALAEGASLQPALTSDQVTITTTNTTVTVSVEYDVPLLTPVLGGAGSLKVTRSVTMPRQP